MLGTKFLRYLRSLSWSAAHTVFHLEDQLKKAIFFQLIWRAWRPFLNSLTLLAKGIDYDGHFLETCWGRRSSIVSVISQYDAHCYCAFCVPPLCFPFNVLILVVNAFSYLKPAARKLSPGLYRYQN